MSMMTYIATYGDMGLITLLQVTPIYYVLQYPERSRDQHLPYYSRNTPN